MGQQFGTRTRWIYKLELGVGHRLTREERLRKPLTYDDAVAIREQCPPVEAVSVVLFRQLERFGLPASTVKCKGQEILDAQFSRATAEHLRLIHAPMADGRFFTAVGDRHRRKVAVVGAEVVKRFFEHEDPVGKVITVDGHLFEVIGTLGKFKAVLSDNPDDCSVLIPYFTYKKLYPNAKENLISVPA